ncbi:MAG TPA: radical SAM protein [Bryobacteraceae bacterium]|nr:radical SAM protein [Bryobacteraceae bacterium]
MRAWNRAKLLWGYLTRQSVLPALPVEYIVETTAKCNLYCPMCPRETHKQPKADMSPEVFDRLVQESGRTAEHMMLIGLGEPFLDPLIFDRIEYCHRHSISTLLSTNGTFLDEAVADRLLRTPLEQITLSFDGASKETFEFYRKGARFEKVRDNFVRFARMKHARQSSLQVVVQMVRMERNAGEQGEFLRFWRSVPGVNQVRIKADETNLMQPQAGHAAEDWRHPCHYLWRGPLYVKQNGDVYPCCQSYMLDGQPVGRIGEEPLARIWNSPEMQRMRRAHASSRAGEIDICARCCTTIPHPLLVAGSLVFHGRTVRRLLPLVERLTYLSGLPAALLRPSKPLERPAELVQISSPAAGDPARSQGPER